MSPAPYEPVPSTPTRSSGPKRRSHASNSSYPTAEAGNVALPSTLPVASRAAAVWVSLCVSTPPVMREVFPSGSIIIHSSLDNVKGPDPLERRTGQ